MSELQGYGHPGEETLKVKDYDRLRNYSLDRKRQKQESPRNVDDHQKQEQEEDAK